MARGTSSADWQACFLGVASPVGIASICVNDPDLASHRATRESMSLEEEATNTNMSEIAAIVEVFQRKGLLPKGKRRHLQ